MNMDIMSAAGMDSDGGGGGNFYMGDDQNQEEAPKEEGFTSEDNGGEYERQQKRRKENPELVVMDVAQQSAREQNSQFLEELIRDKSNRMWTDPWTVMPWDRELHTRDAEKIEMKILPKTAKRKKMYIINA